MSVLVIGGTGTVGSRVTARLAARGESVRVLTRAPERASGLPHGTGAVGGDLDDRDSLARAMEGAGRLALITPLDPEETRKGVNAVQAAKQAGLRHVAFLSVHHVYEGSHIPHFRSKIEIEEAIRDHGLTYTIVQPNNFFQNDYWFRDALLEQGVYPQPLGQVGLHRVDAGDIAEAMVNALTRPGHENRIYPLFGPDSLTGPETAEIWAAQLGRKVRYGGDDLDAWAAQAKAMMPEWLVEDLKVMYRHFQEHGLRAQAHELEERDAVLGKTPRRFEDFAAETAREWLGQGAGR